METQKKKSVGKSVTLSQNETIVEFIKNHPMLLF